MFFARIAFAQSATRCRMSISATAPPSHADSVRHPAEITCPRVHDGSDPGQRQVPNDNQKKQDPDRNGPLERTGFRPGSRIRDRRPAGLRVHDTMTNVEKTRGGSQAALPSPASRCDATAPENWKKETAYAHSLSPGNLGDM